MVHMLQKNTLTFLFQQVAAIVGGMSVQKQQRQLKNKPNIIVATPGRLWEVFSGVCMKRVNLRNPKKKSSQIVSFRTYIR